MNEQLRLKTREDAVASGATTLIAFVFEQLRRDIVAGVYAAGEKLRVEHIRVQFGVAASTMREALARLIANGLVTAEGQRGFRVAPMSIEDLRDITRLRRVLETEALVESIRRADLACEARVVAAFHKLSRAEERIGTMRVEELALWENANKEFHEALTSACDSPRLLEMNEVLYRQHERYRVQSLALYSVEDQGKSNENHPRPRHRDIHAEHEALLQAFLTRDVDMAKTLLAEHIQKTADEYERRLRMVPDIVPETTPQTANAG